MITIIKNFTANKYYPSANHINCTIDSNNAGKCNFRYICDVYVNGVKVFADKLFPDPSTGYGFFQLSRVLQDYIKTTYPTDSSSINIPAASGTAPDSAFAVYCRFGEEYDTTTTCDGQVLQYPNLATSNTFFVYEGAFDYEDYPTYDWTKWTITGTSSAANTKYFLTNSPREIEVTYNDTYYLDFLWNGTLNSSWLLRVTITDYLGNVGINDIPFSSQALRRRSRIACGPYNINKYFATPVINQTTVKYKVQVIHIASAFSVNLLTEEFTFIVKPPKAYTTRLGFVGLLGSIEQFTFFHRNKASYQIDRKTFERSLQSNYANDWTYAVGDRVTTTYKISAQEKRNVSTFCSKEISEWLYEMWLSPDVFVIDRPELREMRIFREDPNSTAPSNRILIWVNDVEGLAVGNKINVLPERVAWDFDYIGQFTIQSINGNILDVGMIYDSYSLPETTCGWLYAEKAFRRLPVTISDNTIEVKQKLSRPIEYALNYEMAYAKTTLRG